MSNKSDTTLLARLLDTDNDDNIFLFNEEGDEIELEQIAVVSHEQNVYAIMRPIKAKKDEACVFKIDTVDEESVSMVHDEKLADAVLEVYNQKSMLTDVPNEDD